MEFIILGLLQLKPMTGYEIAKFIENNLNMICSSSAGSIQSAIKKLLLNEKIVFDEFVDNGKNKKMFIITEKGKEEFLEWIQNPMQMEKVKKMELSKLFFLGFSEESKREKAIEDYINQLETAKETLKVIKKSFENINADQLRKNCNDKKNVEEIITFQGYTIDYGIASVEFEIGWYKKLLNKINL